MGIIFLQKEPTEASRGTGATMIINATGCGKEIYIFIKL